MYKSNKITELLRGHLTQKTTIVPEKVIKLQTMSEVELLPVTDKPIS